jgi:hypothetical protein
MTNTKRFYNEKNPYLYTEPYAEDCLEELKRKAGLEKDMQQKRLSKKEEDKQKKFDLLLNF